MANPFAWGIVNEWADTQEEHPEFGDADIVIAAPSIDVPLVRAKMKEGARLYAYMESIMIPTKSEDVSPFYLELQKAMQYRAPFAAFWCDGGTPINFGTEAWPQSRIIPKNTHADWLVDFVAGSAVLKQFDGIYWDDLTREVPKHIYQELPINWEDAATLQTLQKDHAHYINRVASGARARMPADFKFIGNTAKFTQPALDAITVEAEREGQGGATQQDAVNACKNQMAHGMNRETCVIWYGEGEDDVAIAGRWPEE